MAKPGFEIIVKENNPNIELLGSYKSMQDPVQAKCTKCGYGTTFNWEPRPYTLEHKNACPICAGKRINRLVPGLNDLRSWCINNDRQDILDDWDYEENAADSEVPNIPSEIARSNPRIMVHWKCAVCGHPWECTTNKRTTIDKKNHNTAQCPRCSKGGTSFSEQALHYYLSQAFSDLKYRDKSIIGKELDFYIPSKKAAIEFDGYPYHKDKLEKDNEKDRVCHEAGINIYRVRDNKLQDTQYAKIYACHGIQDRKAFENAIRCLLIDLDAPISPDVDIYKDYGLIIQDYKRRVVENNLSITHKELSKEWHPTGNGKLLPENFTAGEDFPAMWKCSVCGHEWQAPIYSRAGGENGCPECGKKKQGQAYRALRASMMNLKTWCIGNDKIDLLEEWDYDANAADETCPNTPEECPYGSPRPVHWICKQCGHKWPADPAARRAGKRGCEKCNNTKLFPGFNDLKTWCEDNDRQDILDDWDYEENRKDAECPNGPEEVKYNDGSCRVHWKCAKCGYPWATEINRRTTLNRGCWKCAHKGHSTKRRKVKNVETGDVYKSLSEAERAMGGESNSRLISRSCREEGVTAYGYHWCYYDDNIL